MDSSTHGEFIIGKDFNVFIDGVPDKCDHDWSGEIIHFVSPLRTNEDPEACEYHIKNSEVELDKLEGQSESEKFYNWDKILREKGYYVSGGAVSCINCGKGFEPPMF